MFWRKNKVFLLNFGLNNLKSAFKNSLHHIMPVLTKRLKAATNPTAVWIIFNKLKINKFILKINLRNLPTLYGKSMLSTKYHGDFKTVDWLIKFIQNYSMIYKKIIEYFSRLTRIQNPPKIIMSKCPRFLAITERLLWFLLDYKLSYQHFLNKKETANLLLSFVAGSYFESGNRFLSRSYSFFYRKEIFSCIQLGESKALKF